MAIDSVGLGRRIALSLAAVVLGWAAAYSYFEVAQLLIQGRITDVAAMLFWPALFVAAGWIVFVLPVVVLIRPTAWLFSPSRAWLFGGLAGLMAFFLLLSWWTPFWKSLWYLGFSFIVGAVSCTVYSMGLARMGFRPKSQHGSAISTA
jgi:hypothetical protein